MAAEFAHHRKSVLFGVFLDGCADIANERRAHLIDCRSTGIQVTWHKSFWRDRGIADVNIRLVSP